MNKKLVYIGFAFSHHKGTHAGYHQIREYLNYDYVVDCQAYFDKSQFVCSKYSLSRRLYRKVLGKVFGVSNIPWYLFRLLWLGIRYNNLVFHYIYGENIFFPWIKKFMRCGNVVVCTFHQPYSFFQTHDRWKSRIKKSDYIILVGNTELDDFKKMTGKDNVVYIKCSSGSSEASALIFSDSCCKKIWSYTPSQVCGEPAGQNSGPPAHTSKPTAGKKCTRLPQFSPPPYQKCVL